MRRITILLLAMFASLGLFAKDTNPDKLRVALLPDENASTVIKNNKPLQDYLEAQTGKKVELIVTTDYSSMIEAMRRGRIELGYFGPLSYVMAKSKSPEIEAFAAQVKRGSPTYRGIIIGSAERNIDEIPDIKGKTMAYGDPASTSSHLIPKTILKRRGFTSGDDYTEQFLGSHDAVALAVAKGKVDMGGMSEPIFNALIAKGTIKKEDVNILTYSDQFPNYPWTVQGYLDEGLKKKIRDAFIKLEDPKVLKPFKADAFAPMADSDYDKIRDMGKILKLDFSKM